MGKNFDHLAGDTQREKQWSENPELRKEFNGDKAAYMAYGRAQIEGRAGHCNPTVKAADPKKVIGNV